MIYLDSSVALAQLLAEDRHPPEQFWQNDLVASRLLEYEVWVRIHARHLYDTHHEAVEELLAEVALLEMVPPVLSRALTPFPTELRTLDAIHLATFDFLRQQNQGVRLATYDERMRLAAESLCYPLEPLS